MKNVAILGSTGSIGRQALDVVQAHPDRFRLYGVSAHSSEDAFLALLRAAQPRRAVFSRPLSEAVLGVELSFGVRALCDLAADPQVDVVVLAISGIAALTPLLSALKAGKRVAIANKESLVCGGDLVQEALRQGGGELLPVDSEQSAIFQCLQNGRRDEVEKLILTASGGPFFRRPREALKDITPADGFVIPQILEDNAQIVHITAHIKTTLSNGKVIEEDFDKDIDIKGISSLKAWQMNQNIVYTIKFKPTSSDVTNPHNDDPEDVIITFDPAVADWETVNTTATIQI